MGKKTQIIEVQNISINTVKVNNDDFISLTDIARHKNIRDLKDVVKNWMRNRSTIEFLGLWEKINNPNFKGIEFDPLLFASGSNSFTLSPSKWIELTNAIKEHIIPPYITKKQQSIVYASEADVLNMALFGKTAKQWRNKNPDKEGNIRDYASIEQLLVLANIESMNAEFIRMELPQGERLLKLNKIAITQIKSLTGNPHTKKLTDGRN